MKKILFYVSMIYGIIVTSLMSLVFGPKIIGLIHEEGIKYFIEIPQAFVNWYDNPTAFFFTYLIGYGIIFWNPIKGSAIIIIGDFLFFVFNSQNMGTFIFIIPTFFVAFLYILYDVIKNNGLNIRRLIWTTPN